VSIGGMKSCKSGTAGMKERQKHTASTNARTPPKLAEIALSIKVGLYATPTSARHQSYRESGLWRDISSLLLPIACLAPATCLYALEPFLLFV
jgi:hypothetical protein